MAESRAERRGGGRGVVGCGLTTTGSGFLVDIWVCTADANAPDAYATQDDVARIITQIQLRDERIMTAEAELRTLREDMWRIQEEQRKLREDTLPLIRLAKDKSAPLPTPEGLERGNPLSPVEGMSPGPNSQQGSSLARKFSKKGLYLGGKMPSPTIHENSSGLEASAAAMAASNHLTASMTSSQSQGSPRLSQQPSPTSPPYTQTNHNRPFNERSHWQPGDLDRDNQQSRVQTPLTARRPGTASMMNPINTSVPNLQQPRADSATLAQSSTLASQPGDPLTVTPISEHAPSSAQPPNSSSAPSSAAPPNSSSGNPSTAKQQKPHDTADFMKSFRVGMEEPCYKVLPQALKKYNINDDWRLYSLYIVHGDQERCLGLDERPLILFKQLANEGKKPMFMLRKHAAPQSYASTMQLPGGVL
ncbi:hypothetical protein FH972_024491 [Carpinus fangiana]|uniref:Ras-associating domain-containing protein n=1 Tax=Carpinus fangiana TaxID=176857 RepID=A0A5N6KZ30_9ROSI|nr:hypothetical protein FH972_024491 [Carpinus fangiana]